MSIGKISANEKWNSQRRDTECTLTSRISADEKAEDCRMSSGISICSINFLNNSDIMRKLPQFQKLNLSTKAKYTSWLPYFAFFSSYVIS